MAKPRQGRRPIGLSESSRGPIAHARVNSVQLQLALRSNILASAPGHHEGVIVSVRLIGCAIVDTRVELQVDAQVSDRLCHTCMCMGAAWGHTNSPL